jgi:hypothetical protein
MGRLPKGALVTTGVGVLAIWGTMKVSVSPDVIRAHPHILDSLLPIGFLLLLVAAVDWVVYLCRKPETNKPKLALTMQLANAFAVVHLAGGTAQHVQIEPIRSALGRSLWIRFDPVDFLGRNRPEAYPDFWLDIGGKLRGERDMGKAKAVFFVRDAWGRESVEYPVTISFLWNGRKMTEYQTLRWHSATRTLTTSDTGKGR